LTNKKDKKKNQRADHIKDKFIIEDTPIWLLETIKSRKVQIGTPEERI
jgi:hypothetical protein